MANVLFAVCGISNDPTIMNQVEYVRKYTDGIRMFVQMGTFDRIIVKRVGMPQKMVLDGRGKYLYELE